MPTRRGGLHHPRARGDAPGDAALHVASPPACDRSARPPAMRYEHRGDAGRRTHSVAMPAGHRDARRRRAAAFRSAGTTSSASSASRSPRFDIDAHNVTNAEFLAFVDAGGYGTREWWSPDELAWRRRATASGIPRSGSRTDDGWQWRGMFETVPLPAAWPVYVSHGGSDRLRALARPPAADRGRVPSRRVSARPGDDRARIRGATPRRPPRTATSTSRAGSRSRAARIRPGASAWGVARSRRQRLGVDVDGVRAVPGLRADGRRIRSTRPTSSTAQHYVMKGASPATARELLRPSFRNWFRPHYPYVYATFRTVREHADAHATATRPTCRDRHVRRRRRATTWRRRRSSCRRRYLYDALGSALFDAICRLPWYRITRAETRLLARARAPRSSTAAAARPRGRSSSSAAAAARSSTAPRRGARAARRQRAASHLIDISPQALEQTAQRLHRPATTISRRRATGATYEEGLRTARAARARRQHDAGRCSSARTSATSIRRRRAVPRPDPRRARARATRCCSAPTSSSRSASLLLAYDDPLGVTAAFNRNLLVRINRELGGEFDLEAFAHRAVWNARESRIEMHLVSRARQRVTIPAAGVASPSAAASRSGPRARTSTNRTTSSGWAWTRASRRASSGSTRKRSSR